MEKNRRRLEKIRRGSRRPCLTCMAMNAYGVRATHVGYTGTQVSMHGCEIHARLFVQRYGDWVAIFNRVLPTHIRKLVEKK